MKDLDYNGEISWDEYCAFAANSTYIKKEILNTTISGAITALKDKDADVCYKAAYALGEIKDRRALEPLKELQNDPSPIVREEAKKAIKKIEARK